MPTKTKKSSQHVLTPAKAGQIRKLYATGKWSQRKLAVKFGCSRSCIYGVTSGQTWND